MGLGSAIKEKKHTLFISLYTSVGNVDHVVVGTKFACRPQNAKKSKSADD